jgi:hypothetical protein
MHIKTDGKKDHGILLYLEWGKGINAMMLLTYCGVRAWNSGRYEIPVSTGRPRRKGLLSLTRTVGFGPTEVNRSGAGDATGCTFKGMFGCQPSPATPRAPPPRNCVFGGGRNVRSELWRDAQRCGSFWRGTKQTPNPCVLLVSHRNAAGWSTWLLFFRFFFSFFSNCCLSLVFSLDRQHPASSSTQREPRAEVLYIRNFTVAQLVFLAGAKHLAALVVNQSSE